MYVLPGPVKTKERKVQSPISMFFSSFGLKKIRSIKGREIYQMNQLSEFPITTMGIRVIVTVIIIQICLLNSRQISAWSVAALLSRHSSGESRVSEGSVRYLRENAVFTRPSAQEKYTFNQKKSSNDNWTELVLTIQWPQSFCMEVNDSHTGNEECKVPAGVNDWTLHGLWPSNPGSIGPEFCNNTWKFDVTKIGDLESQMNASWPNFLTDQTYDSLWSHEWDKHGTCASSLPALYGEHNYFLKTLTLRKQYDVKGMLEASSIVPSKTKSYDYQSIFNAVKNVVGTDPTLTCVYDQRTHLVYLSEIEFCMDKQFNLTDCVAPSSRRKLNLRDENCANDKLIFYPPVMN